MDQIEKAFLQQGYIVDKKTLLSLYLVQTLQKPLLIEGPAGVGKTELAKVLSQSLNTKLIRLQCYEGLDVHHALYEWNYAKQMLYIQLTEKSNLTLKERQETIFNKDFLLTRPLLEALIEKKSPVLLIDEVDRADEEFEAFLLEFLAEFQITIPELGTMKATNRPYVILTSNRTRELSDALRRRCLYQWMTYPSFEKEIAIIKARFPHIEDEFSRQIATVMKNVRKLSLYKIPGIAESLDWTEVLLHLQYPKLDKEVIKETLGSFVKDRDDWEMIEVELEKGNLLL